MSKPFKIDDWTRTEIDELKSQREEIFPKKEDARYKVLEKISMHVIKEWQNVIIAPSALLYAPANDHTHCVIVEKMLYRLLQVEGSLARLDLTKDEWFYLIASIWLHDIGMLPRAFNEKEAKERELEGEEWWYSYIRKEHHERSADYIEKHYRELGLRKKQVGLLNRFCRLHRPDKSKKLLRLKEQDGESSKQEIRHSMLIAYLKLAETFFIPEESILEDVAPERLEDELSLVFLSIKLDFMSKFHWIKSKYASGIILIPDERKILVKFEIPEEPGWEDKIKPLEDLAKRKFQDEIDIAREIIIKNHRPVRDKKKINPPFYLSAGCKLDPINMTPTQKLELEYALADIVLSNPVITPNASSIIDAVLTQINSLFKEQDRLRGSKHLNGYKINLMDYKTTVLDNILKKRPCHAFLRKIRDLIEKNDNNITLVREKIGEWEKKWKDLDTKLPENVWSVTQNDRIFTPKDSLLLYGYSSSVIRALKMVLEGWEDSEEEVEMEVYVCENATKRQYRHNNRLIYCDGIKYIEELKRIGIERINYVPDSSIANLCRNKKVNKVVFGANGIDLDGNVFHTLGHLTIAEIVKKKEYNIPVIVIADSLKIGNPEEAKPPHDLRSNPWLTTDVEYGWILENKASKIRNYNPREDVVPPELIDCIITEDARIVPNSESNNIRIRYAQKLKDEETATTPIIIGAEKRGSQWGVLGKYGKRIVDLDLNKSHIIFVCGAPRSGKGYTVGVIAEMLLGKIPSLSNISSKARIFVFSNPPDNEPSEFRSIGMENSDSAAIEELSDFSARPTKMLDDGELKVFLNPALSEEDKGSFTSQYESSIGKKNIIPFLESSFLDSSVSGVNILDFRHSDDQPNSLRLMSKALDEIIGRRDQFSSEMFVLVINEAHFYFKKENNEFAEKIVDLSRRATGWKKTWLLIDTQSFDDVPQVLVDSSTIKIVHRTSIDSISGYCQKQLENTTYNPTTLKEGEAIVFATESSEESSAPIKVKIRPRVTQHGAITPNAAD